MSVNRPVRSRQPPRKLEEYLTNLPNHSRPRPNHQSVETDHSNGLARPGDHVGITGPENLEQEALGGKHSEIIVIDDDESASTNVILDHTKLCEFPLGVKESVSVCLTDYKTLQHDTFLNDIIIDFYIKYLFNVFLSKEEKSSVYIFTSMFYKRLNTNPTKPSKYASYENDPSLKPEEKRFRRVKGWTKNVNLFEKNIVVIPICENKHWYLIIAVKPGHIKVSICYGVPKYHLKAR